MPSKDAKDTTVYPNHPVKETRRVTAWDKMTLPLASDGGAVMEIRILIKRVGKT